jgi:hypothetical protein
MTKLTQVNQGWRLTVASVLTVILCSCGNGTEKEQGGIGLNTYSYEMNPKDVEIFLAKVDKLKKGAHLDEVIVALGKPAVDEVLTRKDGSFVARELVYFIKRWEKNLVNEEKDNFVSIYFNNENRLIDYKIHG